MPSWRTKTSSAPRASPAPPRRPAGRALASLGLAMIAAAPAFATEHPGDHPGRSMTVGAARLFVETEGSGPPLVLLPAGPGLDHGYFHPYLSALAPFARVIYLDPRGCGRSVLAGPAGYSLDAMVADLEDVRREMGLETIDLLGHGMGEAVAALYAARHPERVGRLIFLGAALEVVSLPESPGLLSAATPGMREAIEALPGNRYLSEDGRMRERLRILAPLMFHRLTDRSFHNAFAERITTSAEAHDALAPGFAGPEPAAALAAALGRLKAPVLIVAGRHDRTSSPEAAEAVRRAVPGARLVILEESGSFPFAEQPVDFLKAVKVFLTGDAKVGAPAGRVPGEGGAGAGGGI